jgi:hypothetical protein
VPRVRAKPPRALAHGAASVRNSVMLVRTLAALVLLFAACHKGSTTQTPPGGGGGGSAMGSGTGDGSSTGSTGGSDTPPAGPKIGEPCGAGDTCGEGACVKYRGIAGGRGPEFTSCEFRCDDAGNCPSGRKCITIADGPGRVCR